MKKVIAFIAQETVLTVAWILAIISMFFFHPSTDYIEYIDVKSLGILWSLMVIMAGLKETGFFDKIGEKLLKRAKTGHQLALILIFLCFFSSMFITNDVALITFVPFAIFMLDACDREDLLIPVITFQTIAANLGSMLTPIGNPQNLYLYGLSGMSIDDFIALMLPYSALTAVLLLISSFLLKDRKHPLKVRLNPHSFNKRQSVVYGILFLIALLVVCRLIPFYYLVYAVLAVVFFMDKKILIEIDYALLFTFVGFFIFTGNLGRLPSVVAVLTNLVNGHEVLAGVLSSQFISNVPAALLLSGFTENLKGLIIGVNFGGLGTLIASMASLISFKSLAHAKNHIKGRYFIYFTIANVIYLAILWGFYLILS
ncbi:MAG: citrate transporter [Lachnospiraceae bacterium]|nr:citrate transporter [Candidatus Equihabitans merdae]